MQTRAVSLVPPAAADAAAAAAATATAAATAATPGLPRAPQVLLVAPSRSLTFVERDVEILSEEFGVEVLSRQELPSRRSLLPAMARRLWSGGFQLVYVWFADPYDTPAILWLARLFRVPSAVVVGGYEMVSLPALHYGALRDRRNRRRLEKALARADALLPTSELLAGEIRALGCGSRLRVIPPGIDGDFFCPAGGPRERLVVTVATIAVATSQVKGLDVFADCARLVPDARFAILGPCEDDALAERLLRKAGGNLEIPGRRLGAGELRDWYRRAAVYAQLSRRESFGVALAEAMACACVPVATTAGALPWVVGDTGRLVAPGRPGETARALVEALARGPARAARQRIVARFGAARRAAALSDAVRTLIETRGRELPPEAPA
ncbi:MAG: glycosyltransferase family 4 protein [Acidobacteria bacterium]|nr:glycosyltransferase family 4 protein [Acidobacteriota bacterium]